MSTDPSINLVDPSLGISAAASAAQSEAVQNTLATNSASAQTVTFGNMDQLKNASPEIYNAMIQSIAWNICSDSDDFNNTMIEYAKEADEDAQS